MTFFGVPAVFELGARKDLFEGAQDYVLNLDS